MAGNELSTRIVNPNEVDLAFTHDLQGIAQRAWTAGLEGIRDPEEIARAFNPDGFKIVAEAQRQYIDFARLGGLVVVSAGVENPILGFSMARNDVSPYGNNPAHLAVRGWKQVTMYFNHRISGAFNFPNKVYAWEKHIAVQPDAPKGAGTYALLHSLNMFYPDQVSTAYIDDENEQSLAFFKGLGYKWDGKTVKEVHRFGEDNEPTTQRRYAARLDTIRANAYRRLASIT